MASTKDLIAGLTAKEREELLRELEAEEARTDTPTRELSPRERLVGTFLRDRDHLDGCPVAGATAAAYKVEAYDEKAVAPGPELRAVGAQAGDTVTVARCHGCGGVRYLAGSVRQNIAQALAGEQAGDRPLDATL